jgi:hypothetical protein
MRIAHAFKFLLITVSSSALFISPVAAQTPPTISSLEPNGGVATPVEGDAVEFKVVASGSPPLSFRWFYADDPEPVATSDTYRIDAVLRMNHYGDYRVEVSNAAGTVTSETILSRPPHRRRRPRVHPSGRGRLKRFGGKENTLVQLGGQLQRMLECSGNFNSRPPRHSLG